MHNNQHPNLRFTCEKAQGPSLPFLDVEVTISDEEFDICLSSVLLYFNSIVPLSRKRGLITCLLHRAYSYSSNDSLLKTEIKFFFFYSNGVDT